MSLTSRLTAFWSEVIQKTQALYLDCLIVLPLFFFIGSQIIIPLPFSPVPVSIQPYTIFLAAWFMGKRGIAGYIVYLIDGACGAPIFSGFSGGIAHLLGPTSGYLLGFIPAAMIIATLKNHAHGAIQAFCLHTLATVTFFVFGVGYLSFFMPLQSAIIHGLVPFIIGDFLFKPLLFVVATQLNTKS